MYLSAVLATATYTGSKSSIGGTDTGLNELYVVGVELVSGPGLPILATVNPDVHGDLVSAWVE